MKKRLIVFQFLCFFIFTAKLTAQLKVDISKNVTNGTEVFIKQAQVFITPPSGYNFLEEYASFINKQNNTSISVAAKKEISYSQFVSHVSNQVTTENSIKLISKEKLEGGYFFVFNFKVQGHVVERIMYVKKQSKGIVYSIANYKLAEADLYKKVLKKSILSIQ